VNQESFWNGGKLEWKKTMGMVAQQLATAKKLAYGDPTEQGFGSNRKAMCFGIVWKSGGWWS